MYAHCTSIGQCLQEDTSEYTETTNDKEDKAIIQCNILSDRNNLHKYISCQNIVQEYSVTSSVVWSQCD